MYFQFDGAILFLTLFLNVCFCFSATRIIVVLQLIFFKLKFYYNF